MSCIRNWKNLNAYELHKALINEYFLTTGSSISSLKRDTSKDKRDIDVIRENHQFLWEEDDSDGSQLHSWEKKLAKKYYDKLYKEYCVGDLSRYKENKIGLRWRTEKELITGKGQFLCGSKTCSERDDLRTWEVNFGYVEQGVKKNALVKIRLCPGCSYKLNYHHKKKEVKRLKHLAHKPKKEFSEVKGSKRDCTSGEGSDKGIENTGQDTDSVNVRTSDSGIWEQHNTSDANEKSREDEFDEYLDQLFL